MKTIGLIGGMSWESSLEYYRIINETVKERLGNLHSAKSIMYSIDFKELELLQNEGKWDEIALIMIDAAHRLERGGAEFIVLCTNTLHKLATEIQNSIEIPLLNIIDVTADKIMAQGLKNVGLLGTKFTMEGDFYKLVLQEKYEITTIIPSAVERDIIHKIIYDELCIGVLNPASYSKFLEIISNLKLAGAEGIILGCTEIPMLVTQGDVEGPLFDTTRIHAEAAVEFALKE